MERWRNASAPPRRWRPHIANVLAARALAIDALVPAIVTAPSSPPFDARTAVQRQISLQELRGLHMLTEFSRVSA